jgi:hypothetical protein
VARTAAATVKRILIDFFGLVLEERSWFIGERKSVRKRKALFAGWFV